jgi:ABC-2 type transport system permease protein
MTDTLSGAFPVTVRWQATRRLRSPVANLVAPLAFPLATWLVISLAFGAAVRPFLPTIVPHQRYAAYLVPLVVLQVVLFGCSAEGVEAWREASSGAVRRLTTFGVERRSLANARAVAYGAVCALQGACLLLVLGAMTGMGRSWWGFLAALPVIFLLGAGIGALANGLGLRARSADGVPGLVYAIFLPLTLLSTAYVPVGLFPSGAQPLARANPVTWLAESLRDLLAGAWPPAGDLAGALALCVAPFLLGQLLVGRQARLAGSQEETTVQYPGSRP